MIVIIIIIIIIIIILPLNRNRCEEEPLILLACCHENIARYICIDDIVFVQLASTATGLSDESQKKMRSATTAV